MNDKSELSKATNPGGSGRKKLALLFGLAIIAGLLYWQLGDRLSLDYLVSQELRLRSLRAEHPLLIAMAATAIYVVVTGLSLPGAAVLSLFYGWYFGFWQALLIVSFSSTAGASVAFLLSRYFLRDWLQEKLKHRIAPINTAFEQEGAFYLFSLRLIPIIPFFVINAVMGLTSIGTWTFWWVSQIGMLPGTMAYVYAGSAVPSLQSLAENGVRGVLNPQLLIAFAIIGVLPLIMRRALAAFGHTPQKAVPNEVAAETRSANQPATDELAPESPLEE